MQLEDQVCSFVLAKKLLTLGAKQNSLFYYSQEISGDYNIVYLPNKYNQHVSAFTVAELGEMFPAQRPVDHSLGYIEILMYKYEMDSEIYYMLESVGDEIFDVVDKNEANARAKMLIYLLENGLIKNEL